MRRLPPAAGSPKMLFRLHGNRTKIKKTEIPTNKKKKKEDFWGSTSGSYWQAATASVVQHETGVEQRSVTMTVVNNTNVERCLLMVKPEAQVHADAITRTLKKAGFAIIQVMPVSV